MGKIFKTQKMEKAPNPQARVESVTVCRVGANRWLSRNRAQGPLPSPPLFLLSTPSFLEIPGQSPGQCGHPLLPRLLCGGKISGLPS